MLEAIGTMPISPYVADQIAYVAEGASLLEVADVLTNADVGALAVGDSGRVVGIVSERDVVHALARRLPAETTSAIDIASTELVWCDASATIGEVATEMMERYVRHVLVEEEGRLVGLVSARDLLGAYASASDPDEPSLG